jgi:hypothetical protein
MAGAPAGETLASLVAKGTAPSAAASVAVDAAVELLQELKLVTEVHCAHAITRDYTRHCACARGRGVSYFL